MKTQNLLSSSLTTRWDKYKAGLKTCRREFSEEAVHDFRVATRRMLSFLDMLRTLMQDPKIQKLRRALKNQLDDLDDLRDAQVLLADISEAIRETPALQSFQEYLRHEEKKLLRAARKEIKSLKIVSFSKRIGKLIQKIEELEQADLEGNLLSAIDEAFAVVNQRYALIDPQEPATIHRLRIAFKKFRYMVEVVYPILQGLPADHLKKLHDYQAAMGDIQDMEVALQKLADFDEQSTAPHDLEPVRLYYKERHALALSRYIEDKGELINVWRTAPDQQFP